MGRPTNTEVVARRFIETCLFPEHNECISEFGFVPYSAEVNEKMCHEHSNERMSFIYTTGYDIIWDVLRKSLPALLPKIVAQNEEFGSIVANDGQTVSHENFAIVTVVINMVLAMQHLGMIEFPMHPDWMCQQCGQPHFRRPHLIPINHSSDEDSDE